MCRWHSAWTDERVTTLRKLWLEGLSASQIARQMGGVSRNAVIGKVHRIGLAGRMTAERKVKKNPRRTRAARTPAAPRYVPSTPDPDTPERRTIAALPPIDPTLTIDRLNAFTCRYPIGDPQDPAFTYCGRTCDEAQPYCCAHAKLTHTAPSRQRDNATARLARWLDGQGKRAGISV